MRSPIGVKVFGANLDQIQQVSQEISTVLRGIRGASNVVPDQVVGKGYIDIRIDRKKAARYGIQIGDIQDVVEVAMGGKPLTMTVEGRERYPVRVRYARAFRDDLESLKRILVSARAPMADPGAGMRSSAGMGEGSSPAASSSFSTAPDSPGRGGRCAGR